VEIPTPVDRDGVTRSILAFYATPKAEWSDRAARGRVLLSQALAWPRIGRQLVELFD
jgi:hypothetical protein